ncbi:MAG: hypothetical protein JWR37_2676 [Mycobacterium sp.]|nr:hypothetical protein [Mycobacterium sp.]
MRRKLPRAGRALESELLGLQLGYACSRSLSPADSPAWCAGVKEGASGDGSRPLKAALKATCADLCLASPASGRIADPRIQSEDAAVTAEPEDRLADALRRLETAAGGAVDVHTISTRLAVTDEEWASAVGHLARGA